MSAVLPNATAVANRMRTGFARVGNNQTTGRLARFDAEGTPTSACALGALALGFQERFGSNSQLDDIRANRINLASLGIANPNVTPPTGGYDRPLEHVIVELNDNKGWSIEKIARWIESLGDEDSICETA